MSHNFGFDTALAHQKFKINKFFYQTNECHVNTIATPKQTQASITAAAHLAPGQSDSCVYEVLNHHVLVSNFPLTCCGLLWRQLVMFGYWTICTAVSHRFPLHTSINCPLGQQMHFLRHLST